MSASDLAFEPPAAISHYIHVKRFLGCEVVGFNPSVDAKREAVRPERAALGVLDRLVYALSLEYDDPRERFVERLEALLDDPQVGRLRGLVLGNWFGEVCEEAPVEAYQLLIEHGARLGALRGMFLGDVISEEAEISWLHQDDCGPLLQAFPALEELVVRGGEGLRFSGLTHASLRSLTVQTGGLSAEAARDIAGATLPALRSLTVWLGDENYGGTSTVVDLEPLLSGERFPALEHLGLQDSEHADEIAVAIARSPLLGRLKGLDLSMGTLTDVGGRALLESPHIGKLAHLNLRWHWLSEPVMAELKALGPHVDVSDRQTDQDFRYVEVSE